MKVRSTLIRDEESEALGGMGHERFYFKAINGLLFTDYLFASDC